MELRSGKPEDRQELRALLEKDGLFTPAEIECALELIDLALARGEASGYLLLVAADQGDRPAGYACYGPTPMTGGGVWDLYWIATHPDCRGRGVASQLMERMEMDIRRRGGRQVRIETSEQETYGAARHLYAKWRYGEAGRIEDFYQPGDALLTFVKRL